MFINFGSALQEKLVFFHQFVRSPKQVGSITPSSRYLARAMTGQACWEKVRAVAELGAGTGALTNYIKRAAHEETRVFLFETEPSLREQLARAFPAYTCHADACYMEQVFIQSGYKGNLDLVFSGLPFFNFPQVLRTRLLEQISASLKPGGRLIAFQYSLQMKPLLQQYFEMEAVRFVPLNVPPAFVYVCRNAVQDRVARL